MLRKTTGMALMLVMTVIIALQHPALKFCTCQEALMLSQCPCPESVEVPVAKVESCHDCCGEPPVTDLVCETQDSPEDCAVDLTFDLGDYLAFGSFEFQANDGNEQPVVPTFLDTLVLSPEMIWTMDRGSPDPPPLSSNVPLFVRHSVYLI